MCFFQELPIIEDDDDESPPSTGEGNDDDTAGNDLIAVEPASEDLITMANKVIEEDSAHSSDSEHELHTDLLRHNNSRKRLRLVDDESQGDSNILEENNPPSKIVRRKWSHEDTNLICTTFKTDINNKRMPDGKRMAALLPQLSTKRTIAQLRTQINNYIKGKTATYRFDSNC